ncbi:hypothetical protein [Pantoea sp. B65]|uniref:hypothetical protein n=1 Tax=Pantoea sp. B65 TaxID=2813359 RepID=UPI0039B6E29E
MNDFEFSIQSDAITLQWQADALSVKLPAGYAAVTAGLLKAGKATAYDVEMMIYRIEEIIESDAAVKRVKGDAVCRDQLLKQVCDSYLAGATVIEPVALEAAFNQLADSLSYSALMITAEKIPLLSCFVIIREMIHHLDIRKITCL